MPNSTNDGRLTTPDQDAANDMEMWLLDLAEQVADLVPHVALGVVTVNLNNESSKQGNIAFPANRFTSTPIVLCQSRDSSYIVTTGTGNQDTMPITVRHFDNVAQSASVIVSYMAMTY